MLPKSEVVVSLLVSGLKHVPNRTCALRDVTSHSYLQSLLNIAYIVLACHIRPRESGLIFEAKSLKRWGKTMGGFQRALEESQYILDSA